MRYQVFLAKNGKFIICQVNSEMTTNTAIQFAADIQELSINKNIFTFLIDLRQTPNAFSIIKNYKYI